MRINRIAGARVLVAVALAVALSSCGGEDSAAPAPADIDTDAPPLHSFDMYALGSEAGNDLFADVYGISLNPLRSYRLTADKRVSWLSASADAIAVAAADEQIDKLAFLSDGGQMVP